MLTVTARERVGVGLAIAAIVAAYAWSAHFWVDLVDEGYFLDLGQRVLDGALPYRDFTTYYTPGIFYLFALLFKLFGTNLLVVRYAMAVLRGACALLLYCLTRRVAPWPIAWLPFAVVAALDAWPIEPEPHPSWPSVVAGLVVLECIVRHLSTNRLRWLALAGAAAGVGYLFKQNVGAFSALGIGGYVLLRPRTDVHRQLRVTQVAFVVGAAALVTLLMRESMDVPSAGALWLPVVATLAILMVRAVRASPGVDGSPSHDVVAAALPFVVVTLAWLVPLLVAIGPAQTPLGLFVGDVNQASITTRFADVSVGIPPLLLGAIWLPALLYRRAKAPFAVAAVLSVLVLLLPIWQGPHDDLTADPGLAPLVGFLDVNWGTLHLYLPALAAWAGVAGLLLTRNGGPFPWFVLFGTLANLELYPRSDTLHTIVALPPILIVAAAALAMLHKRLADADLPRWRQTGIFASLLFVPLLAVAPQVAWRAATIIAPDDTGTRLDYAPLGLATAPVLVPRATADEVRGVVEYVQAGTPPGQPVFAYPVIPLVNFLANRPNPTAFDHYLPDTLSPTQLERAVAELDAARPRYVVWDHLGVQFWQTEPANAPISDYVWSCYEQVATFRLYLVLERRADAC